MARSAIAVEAWRLVNVVVDRVPGARPESGATAGGTAGITAGGTVGGTAAGLTAGAIDAGSTCLEAAVGRSGNVCSRDGGGITPKRTRGWVPA